MLKKLLAILLSLTVLMTSLFTGLVVSAEGVNNLVANGDLSATDNFSTSRVLSESSDAVTYGVWGPLGTGVNCLSRSEDENGNGYLVYRSSGSYYRMGGQVIDGLTANTDYVLSFKAKNNISVNVGVGVKKVAKAVIRYNNEDKLLISDHQVITVSDDWVNYRIDFNTGDNTSVILAIGTYLNEITDTVSTCCFDDFVLCAADEIIYITANAEFGGTVSGGGAAVKGETVNLKATAKSGYEFAGWSDGETSPNYSFVASESVTLTAKFNKITADYLPNGDFEADDWQFTDCWSASFSGAKYFESVTDPTNENNTVAYAKGGAGLTAMVSKETFTLKKGHTYRMYFDSYIPDTVSTANGPQFYMAGFYKEDAAGLGSANAYEIARVYSVSNGSGNIGKWHKSFGVKYTYTGEDGVKACVAFGMFNADCTSDWYIDNIVVYDEADVLSVTAEAENGTATGSKSGIFRGETVTFTATSTIEDATFLGWFAEGGDTPVSTDEKWTFRVTESATYVAKYQLAPSKNLIVNGEMDDDFNMTLTTNISPDFTEGVWGKVGTGVDMFTHTTTFAEGVDDPYVNGSGYITATVPAQGYIRSFGQYITVEPNTDYVLDFVAKNNAEVDILAGILKGDLTGTFAVQNNDLIDATASCVVPLGTTQWTRYTLNFNTGSYTKVIVAFGGNVTNAVYAGQTFGIDNVVVSKVAGDIITDFENDNHGWTASDGASIEVGSVSGTPFGGMIKYVGQNIAVFTPDAEGATFTSPAFDTEVGKTYELVF